MIFTPVVIAALQILKNNAENDFELHRISVLEKDLTFPPKPEVIDETHQKFNGVLYTSYASQTPGYFQNISKIYYDVYRYYKGEIPVGDYNIHHIDHNPFNNDISNLMLLTKEEHKKIHRFSKRGVKHQIKTFTCIECGKKYEASLTGGWGNKFCSRKCHYRFYANQEGVKQHKGKTTGTCQVCGKIFSYYPNSQTGKYCSQDCAHKASRGHKKPPKKCAWCGKEFYGDSNSQLCCSLSCAGFLREKHKREVKSGHRVNHLFYDYANDKG